MNDYYAVTQPTQRSRSWRRWKDKYMPEGQRTPELTALGKKLMKLCKLAAYNLDFDSAVVEAYGYRPHFNTFKKLKKSDTIWQYIRHFIRERMYWEHGVSDAEKHVMDRVELAIDHILKRMREANDSDEAIRLSAEFRKLNDMLGGRWLGLDKSGDQVGTFQQTWSLQPVREVKQIEEAEVEETSSEGQEDE